MNKQIIVNGVDVSGCCYYNPNIKMDCLLHPLQSDACKNNPNCHYKLYKRKEQECDMWKNLTVDNGAVALKNQQQLDQLKAKNEDLLSVQYKLADNNKRLRQTLIEIKEIIEQGVKIHDDIIVNKQILQKCEVLNEK